MQLVKSSTSNVFRAWLSPKVFICLVNISSIKWPFKIFCVFLPNSNLDQKSYSNGLIQNQYWITADWVTVINGIIFGSHSKGWFTSQCWFNRKYGDILSQNSIGSNIYEQYIVTGCIDSMLIADQTWSSHHSHLWTDFLKLLQFLIFFSSARQVFEIFS